MEFIQDVVEKICWDIVQSAAGVGISSIPANVLRNDDGTPIRNDDSEYIYTD